MNNFILSCESTVDMPFALMQSRDIPVLFYSYTVGDKAYEDDMDRDPQALPAFYERLQKDIPSTSQINEFQYIDFFTELLKKGDVLHIVFSSGLTRSMQGAEEAAKKLREEFPDRKLILIDSQCASSGYGMLVDGAADERDKGRSIDEVAAWVDTWRHRIHHVFYSTDLKYFRRSGRMSGATATVASILNICPILRIDADGKIVAYEKVRGKRNAIQFIMDEMTKHAVGGDGYSGKVFISHSNVFDDAMDAKQAIEEHFKSMNGEVQIYNIGTIIASHTGPGTVAIFFFGDERV